MTTGDEDRGSQSDVDSLRKEFAAKLSGLHNQIGALTTRITAGEIALKAMVRLTFARDPSMSRDVSGAVSKVVGSTGLQAEAERIITSALQAK